MGWGRFENRIGPPISLKLVLLVTSPPSPPPPQYTMSKLYPFPLFSRFSRLLSDFVADFLSVAFLPTPHTAQLHSLP